MSSRFRRSPFSKGTRSRLLPRAQKRKDTHPKTPKRTPKQKPRTRSDDVEIISPDIVNLVETRLSTVFKRRPSVVISSDDEDSNRSVIVIDDSFNASSGDTNINKPGCSRDEASGHAVNRIIETDGINCVDHLVAAAGETANRTEVDSQNMDSEMDSFTNFYKDTEDLVLNTRKLLEELKSKTTEEPEPKNTVKTEGKRLRDCPICMESMTSQTSATICGHMFCTECIKQWCATSKRCPTCRKPISAKKIFVVYV